MDDTFAGAPDRPSDKVAARGGAALLRLIAAARAEVAALPSKHPGDPPAALLARARRVVLRLGPRLARALTDGILAAWVTAGRPVARAAAPALVSPPPTLPPVRPPPPPGSDDFRTGVRWPAVEAAARDLAARRVLTASEWIDAADDAKAAAFAVARVLTRPAAETIRDAVLADVTGGGTLDDFRRATADAFAGALSAPQVETVYRTQIGLAAAAGLRAVLAAEPVADEFPFLMYTAVRDSRTRHDHAALERLGLDGTAIYWRDDPIWESFFPPWEWNCRCWVVPYSVEDAAAAGVKAAKRWLATGVPPKARDFASPPAFRPPPGFPRTDRVRPAVGGADAGAVRLSWDGSKHPRGQPENAGEFAPKGGPYPDLVPGDRVRQAAKDLFGWDRLGHDEGQWDKIRDHLGYAEGRSWWEARQQARDREYAGKPIGNGPAAGATGVKRGGRKEIPVSKLYFPGGLLPDVTPLNGNRDQPIIVKKKGSRYEILDGVGRASGLTNAGKSTAHAIVVSDADLGRDSRGGSDNPEWVKWLYAKYAPELEYRASTN